jgi:hypothetical protein
VHAPVKRKVAKQVLLPGCGLDLSAGFVPGAFAFKASFFITVAE